MATLKLSDGPFSHLLLRFVLKSLALNASRQLKRHISCGAGHWELKHDLGCKVVLGELSTSFQRELKSVA